MVGLIYRARRTVPGSRGTGVSDYSRVVGESGTTRENKYRSRKLAIDLRRRHDQRVLAFLRDVYLPSVGEKAQALFDSVETAWLVALKAEAAAIAS